MASACQCSRFRTFPVWFSQRVKVSDEEFAELEHLAQALGVTLEELLKRSVAAYLPQIQAEITFEPIGFGMWADRPEMQDAAKWVADLREREWTR